MFIPNNDIKIVCKLEKDDRSIVSVSGISSRVTHYNKVKVTTIVSNVSLDVDISIFNPAAYYIGQNVYNHRKPTLYYANQNSPSSVDYKEYSLDLHPLDNTFLSVHSGVFHSNLGQPNDIIIDPKSILTVDGKLLDTTQYTGTKKLQFVTGREVSSEINAIDLYDYDNGNRGNKVGTLPTTFLAFDKKDNQINLFSWKKNFILSASQISKNNGYFTIKYETDGIVGYISDSNGNPDPTLNNKFQLNISVLDFIQLAQIEELAQKNLELEECHSAALSTAQVKGKAISTVVNRVKRQVEEDETFKGDIKDLLKGDKDFKDSVRGERGLDGIPGAPATQVAQLLLTQKTNELGKAIIAADSSSQHPLSSWLKDQLKGDQGFQENVADELLERTNGNSIVSEVAKRINKRSVEDRAVKKVTDKVDVQDIVDKVDPYLIMKYQVDKLIEAIDSSTAERIIRDNSGSRQTRFVDQLIKIVGKGTAKDIVSDKITDPSLLIDKLLEKSSDLEQNIIAILTDPNNTELIIKVFAEKYPEIDIESIIKNLQKPRAARDFNVRNSFKQGEEAAQQAEIAQKSAENARDEAKGFANQAQSSAKEATSAKDASINSLHDIAQRYSNLNRDKSSLFKKAHKVKRSTVEENVSEETTQMLTMHDIRRLLEKNASGSANRVKRNAKNMVDLSEEKTVKEIEKINSQVTQMESEVSEVKDMFTQVDESQQEIQERMQEIERDVHQVGSDSLNAQRMNRKIAQRAEDSELKAKQAAEESVDARDESQIFAENSSNSANEAQVSVEKAARAIEKIEEEIKDIEQRIPQASVNTAQEKKHKLKIVQSGDDLTEIEVEGKGVIGKFSKAGYYFRSGQLHIHNPETGIDIVIPSEFNLLKVVENSEMPTHYMLVLTNQLGNELFEYKKYDPTFSSLANEFKSLDLQQIKTLNKINFQNGSYFILKPGAVSSQGYAVNVHEIESNEKIGTLVDEFCYYQNGKFNYMNYHTGSEIHHSSSHEHYLSLSHSENYQAESSIVCEESSEKVAHDVNPIITSEFGLLEYLADHSPI